MTAFIVSQTANEGARIEVGSYGLNDYSVVMIAEPYARQAPQMTGWANQLNLVDPLWPRSSLLGSIGQNGITTGAGGILQADCQRWEWNFPPTGAHRRKDITGIVIDSNSSPVSGATVWLFNTATGTLVDTQTSAADGTFSCGDPNAVNCMAVAYKSGSPDVSAVSADTLAGT